MKKISSRLVALVVLIVVFMFNITGCAPKIDNVNTAVATLDGKEIPVGVVNFIAKYQQANIEGYYKSLFGDNMWKKDIYGNGTTFEDTTKEDILNMVKEMYILDAHKDEYNVTVSDEELKKIEAAAEEFVNKNSDKANNLVSGTKEIVAEVLRLYTVQVKMSEAIMDKADKNVTDEEAAQKTISYIKYNVAAGKTDESGKIVDYTEEEKSQMKADAQAVLDKVKENVTLEDAIKDTDYKVQTFSYGKDIENLSIEKEVLEAANKLKEGEYASLIVTDDAYYVVRLDKEFDREATDKNKETIVATRKNDLYEEVVKGWSDKAEFKLIDAEWEKIKFTTPINIITDKTSEVQSEGTTETSTEGVTEVSTGE